MKTTQFEKAASICDAREVACIEPDFAVTSLRACLQDDNISGKYLQEMNAWIALVGNIVKKTEAPFGQPSTEFIRHETQVRFIPTLQLRLRY